MFHDRFDDLVIIRVWHLEQWSESNFIIVSQVFEKMRRWYFSFVNMIDYDPHLFRVDLYYSFDLFFLTKNFISRSYHGHLSNFWKWRVYVLCKLTFKLFDYLLIVWKMHLFNTCQNKQRFITHMCIQLSTLKCSCLKHRLAWSTVVRYGVWR